MITSFIQKEWSITGSEKTNKEWKTTGCVNNIEPEFNKQDTNKEK